MKILYLLLDISASMSGDKISSLNDVMQNLSASIVDEDVSVRVNIRILMGQNNALWNDCNGSGMSLLDRTLAPNRS